MQLEDILRLHMGSSFLLPTDWPPIHWAYTAYSSLKGCTATMWSWQACAPQMDCAASSKRRTTDFSIQGHYTMKPSAANLYRPPIVETRSSFCGRVGNEIDVQSKLSLLYGVLVGLRTCKLFDSLFNIQQNVFRWPFVVQ
ncbi:hypothetical protein WJX79_006478 [Trebouxia sp. C0005]